MIKQRLLTTLQTSAILCKHLSIILCAVTVNMDFGPLYNWEFLTIRLTSKINDSRDKYFLFRRLYFFQKKLVELLIIQ